MKRGIWNPFIMFVIGLVLGAISRLFDIYTQNLGDIFSQMEIWILFGVIISIYSETKKKAMLNILPFCIGMLITYYVVAILTDGVYGSIFIIGWTLFALLSPVMACFAWMTKEKGLFPGLIRCGIVACSVFSSIVLFDGFRWYDVVINVVLIYILFFRKVER